MILKVIRNSRKSFLGLVRLVYVSYAYFSRGKKNIDAIRSTIVMIDAAFDFPDHLRVSDDNRPM